MPLTREEADAIHQCVERFTEGEGAGRLGEDREVFRGQGAIVAGVGEARSAGSFESIQAREAVETGLPRKVNRVREPVNFAEVVLKAVDESPEKAPSGSKDFTERIVPVLSRYTCLLLRCREDTVSSEVARVLGTNIPGAHAALAMPLFAISPALYQRVLDFDNDPRRNETAAEIENNKEEQRRMFLLGSKPLVALAAAGGAAAPRSSKRLLLLRRSISRVLTLLKVK